MMTKKILVTGGAGYIGSHTVDQLIAAGLAVVVLDNLYSGHLWAVPKSATFYQGSIADQALLKRIFTEHKIDVVIHLAAHIVVPESVSDPLKYYRTNVMESISLLACCQAAAVNHFVFSSSAAVYGTPAQIPINESMAPQPINPYGSSKLMIERVLQDLSASDKRFKYVILRYFNVAGAKSNGLLGQTTANATHLIKVTSQAACGKRDMVSIYGTDYDTEDGTCVRDYIHVEDLAHAHLDAVHYLQHAQKSVTLNCGYGHGHSVKQVIQRMLKVVDTPFTVTNAPRRVGDPAILIADNQRIQQILGWRPRYDNLDLICCSAWQWEKQGSVPLGCTHSSI